MPIANKKPILLAGCALLGLAGLWSVSGAKRSSAHIDPSQLTEWFQSQGILAFMEINDSLPKCSGALKATAQKVVSSPGDMSISFDVVCGDDLDFGAAQMKTLMQAEICRVYKDSALAAKGIALMPRLLEKDRQAAEPFRIDSDTCGKV